MGIDPSDIRIAGAVPLDPRPAGSSAGTSAGTGPGSGPGSGPGGAVTVVDVTEATFQAEVLDRSQQVPVVIDFWASWCGPCKQLSPILERLAGQGGGSWVLAKIDVDANPRLAQAAQVQGIPAVKAVIGGQIVGEFTGAMPEPQVKDWIEQVKQVGQQFGLPGVQAPSGEDGAAPAEEPMPEYLVKVDEALARDDVDSAVAVLQAELAASPGNAEARAALAQVSLLGRVRNADVKAVREAAAARPDDLDAQLLAADVDVSGGFAEDGFGRLVDLVRRTSGDERDRVRTHLLELFDVIGSDDPRVAKARRDLTTALF